MLKTNRPIEYHAAPYGFIASIPEGTSVIPATNLPESDQFWWVEPWEDMTEQAEGWERNYGFLVTAEEVSY